MFREKFHQFLNPEHEVMRAGRMIPWNVIRDKLLGYYNKKERRPKFIRLMVGLHILKHRLNASEEQGIEHVHENNYWQAFCEFEEPQPPGILDSSSMTKFRQRIGPEGTERMESIYWLQEPKVVSLATGKSRPGCEFGAKVALGTNEDGLVLYHDEYQHSVADVHTMGRGTCRARSNKGMPIQ